MREDMDVWFIVAIYMLIIITCFMIYGKRKGQRIPSLRGKHVVTIGESRGINLAIAMEVLEERGYVTLISNNSSHIGDAISDITQ
jgi:hypothetical protein